MKEQEDTSVDGVTGGFGVTDQWIRIQNEAKNKQNTMPIILALIIGYYFYG